KVRLKSRYFLCEICVSDRSNLSLVHLQPKSAAKIAVSRVHGDHGAEKNYVKYLNAHTGIVLVWSALPFINSLENRGERAVVVPCFLNCLHVGGKTDQLPIA
uniref:Ribonuclease P/MRP protein subunit POP5 n=1 Tax=Oncorhynchus mykiss TaxID=8022 RepID=A0A8C7S2Q3_ONCMY